MPKTKTKLADLIAGVTYAAPCTNCGEHDHARPDCPETLPEIDITTDGFHGVLGRYVVTFTATYPDSTSDWEFIITKGGYIETVGHRTSTGGRWVNRTWQGKQPGDLEATRRYLITCFALGGVDTTNDNEGSN